MLKKTILFLINVIIIFITQTIFAIDLDTRPDIRSYIQYMATHYDFNQAQLTHLFKQVQFNNITIDVIKRPAEAKPWYSYRKILVTQQRAEKGVRYWQQNISALNYAQRRYGVPANIIVAVIGVETGYGSYTGNFPVISSLATLAFHDFHRSPYFQNELTQFLLLSREQNWNPLSIKGSYAGAIGFPQFMPSSYRKYAVDYDKNGKKDLIKNNDDVIVSVANYLSQFGWQRYQPITLPAIMTHRYRHPITDTNGNPKYTIKQLNYHGILCKQKLAPNTAVGLLTLENENSRERWLTFTNFRVIMRYNNSTKYAMAVYQLGQRINALHNHTA